MLQIGEGVRQPVFCRVQVEHQHLFGSMLSLLSEAGHLYPGGMLLQASKNPSSRMRMPAHIFGHGVGVGGLTDCAAGNVALLCGTYDRRFTPPCAYISIHIYIHIYIYKCVSKHMLHHR